MHVPGNKSAAAVRRHAHQEGLALPTVLFLGVVLFMLVTAVAFRGLVGLNQSDRERQQNETLHIADGAIDKALYNLVNNKAWASQASDGSVDKIPAGGVSDERAWALERAALKGTGTATDEFLTNIVATNKGEWAVVKPEVSNLVYAVGWIPSRANPKHTRVLRVEYDFPPFNATNAILTGGNLSVGGSAKILGNAGSVHTNGNFSYTGGGWQIAGSVSASGTYQSGGNVGDPANSGGSKAPQPIPDLNPLDYHKHAMWDLCPDGTIHAGPRLHGDLSLNPCEGPAVDPSDTYGWDAMVGTSLGTVTPTTWRYQTSQCNNGVYYVHNGNVSITGNPGKDDHSCNNQPWQVTILAGALRTAGQQCPNFGGDISIQGTPRMGPFEVATPHQTIADSTKGLLLMAGRDFEMKGNAQGSAFTGAILVHEQFDLTGNMDLNGNLVANDLCHTAGSPVAQNQINLSGSSKITFDQATELPLGKLIRITRWTEL